MDPSPHNAAAARRDGDVIHPRHPPTVMGDTADAVTVLQQLVDDGHLDLLREGPVEIFIVHRGMIAFTSDATGRVHETRNDDQH